MLMRFELAPGSRIEPGPPGCDASALNTRLPVISCIEQILTDTPKSGRAYHFYFLHLIVNLTFPL